MTGAVPDVWIDLRNLLVFWTEAISIEVLEHAHLSLLKQSGCVFLIDAFEKNLACGEMLSRRGERRC